MTIEIGQIAALFALIAAVLTLVDWLMDDDQKRRLGEELKHRLNNRQGSFPFVAKTPILALSSILSAASNHTEAKRNSWRRISSISSLLILACLVTAGVTTGTMLGFKEGPSESYRQELRLFQSVISEERDMESLTDDERRERLQFQQDMNRILETAKHPFARWTALILVALLLGLISVTSTNLSILFTEKSTKAITTTETPLLITGAVVLNALASLLIFILELVALSTVSSILLLFAFSLAGIFFDLGLFWGLASFSGYVVLAWITAPIWLKALATASLVPSLVMIIAIAISFILKPLVKPLSLLTTTFLRRAATHRDGVIAFLATCFICLAAAITAATNLVN